MREPRRSSWSGPATAVALTTLCLVAACASQPPPRPLLPPAPSGAPSASSSAEIEEIPPPQTLAERRVPAASWRSLDNGVALVTTSAPLRDSAVVILELAGLGSSSDGERTGLARLSLLSLVAATGLLARLGELGGTLVVSVGLDQARLTVTTPRSASEAAVLALSGFVLAPPPPPDVFRLTRANEASRVGRLVVEDDGFAATQLLYRRVFQLPVSLHPFSSWAASPAEVLGVTLLEARAFLQRRLSPAGTTLLLANVPADVAERAGRGPLSRFRGAATVDLAALTPPFPPDDTRLLLVDRKGSRVTVMRFGFAGVARSSPAYPAIAVAARLLESALRGDGRVPPTVRVRLLTEVPRGVVPLVVELSTAEDDPAPVVLAVREIMRRVAGQVADPLALAEAKRGVLAPRGGAVVSALHDLLDERATLRELSPEDFKMGVEAVDYRGLPADLGPVLDVPPVLVAVGDADRVAGPLSTVADVDVLDAARGFARAKSLVHREAP